MIEAHRLQIPVIPRGEMLAELMRLKYGIAIAGSHGKTTTTSMVASVLAAAGLDPTMVVGGRLNSLGTNARLGKGDFMVVESDESDRSFLHLAPILAVITSIDREHLDCYGSLEELRHAYAEFANKVPFYGAAIVCLDDENVRAIVPQLRRRIVSYGMEPGADVIAESVECGHFQSRFHLRYREEDLGGFELRVPGKHNVLNATAAAAVCLELKIEVETIRAALAEFAGVERRFQVRGMVGGVTVVDDYGHHPTEIRATLAAARDCGYARVLAVFQPHRYTRTALLLDDFGPCFDAADAVFVLDIYPAGEPPIEGISSATLVERMRAGARGTVEYQSRVEDVLQKLLGQVQPGDLVLTLGAGNVWQVGERFLELLRERSTRVQAVSSRA
ncbi:MAG: UDP-N-acetylmuramate--L-alanine ligase [Acidobacteria bacterium RIFCSPLOWO2_02_FULL_61_28]|nr:MAG: UDP-N-acetylmuramate--L-alanine ligase [Acidobacteria bacterium RIFCSPLOWO2_02_FULL_61_28]